MSHLKELLLTPGFHLVMVLSQDGDVVSQETISALPEGLVGADRAWLEMVLHVNSPLVMGRKTYEEARPQFNAGKSSRHSRSSVAKDSRPSRSPNPRPIYILTTQPFHSNGNKERIPLSGDPRSMKDMLMQSYSQVFHLGGPSSAIPFIMQGLFDELWLSQLPIRLNASQLSFNHQSRMTWNYTKINSYPLDDQGTLLHRWRRKRSTRL